MSCLDNLAQQYHGLFLLLGVKHNFCQNMYFTKGRFQKKKKKLGDWSPKGGGGGAGGGQNPLKKKHSFKIHFRPF